MTVMVITRSTTSHCTDCTNHLLIAINNVYSSHATFNKVYSSNDHHSHLQVYKGVLRSTGELVAVKVQRPGIGDHIAIDMLLLRRLMGVIDKNQTVVSVLLPV